MTVRTTSLGEKRITRVGLGSNRLTNTKENRSFLNAAVDAGLDFIDTAHVYTDGESERTIGAALAGRYEEIVVATKGGYDPEGGAEQMRAELEQSFESLRTDTIDLYYVHRLNEDDRPFEDTMGLLHEYHEDGRILNVGLSAVSVEQIERAREIVPIAAVQNEYNLGERSDDDVVDYCASEGILFVPFFPLRDGDTQAVSNLAGDAGASASQIVISWLLGRSPAMAPIPGTLSIDHLQENLAALDVELPEDAASRV